MKRSTLTSLALAVVLTASSLSFGQDKDKSKRPSPPAQAQCKFADGKSITVDYSSPRAKGRKIYGGLVPFGKEWRTGANDATTFVTTADLTIGGKDVPAGKYTLYTTPNEKSWTLMINKQTGQWGTEYHQEQDLARVDMKKESLSTPLETFVISFEPQTDPKQITFQWENTKLWVSISEAK